MIFRARLWPLTEVRQRLCPSMQAPLIANHCLIKVVLKVTDDPWVHDDIMFDRVSIC